MEESVMILLELELNAFILPFFFIFLSLLIAHFVKFRNWFGENLQPNHVVWAIPVLAGLLIVGIGATVVADYFHFYDTQQVDATETIIANNPFSGMAFLALSAAGEELFFRGILQTLIGWISVPVFAIMHSGYESLTQVVAALLGGVVFYLARKKTGSIWPGLLAHFFYNILAVFFIRF